MFKLTNADFMKMKDARRENSINLPALECIKDMLLAPPRRRKR